MDESFVSKIVEYGVLGLWTLSLMWRERTTEKRHQAQIERMEERHEEATTQFMLMREKIHVGIVEKRTEFSHETVRAFDRINDNLTALREKMTEDRAFWLSRNPPDEH